jgi:hypothetical protein
MLAYYALNNIGPLHEECSFEYKIPLLVSLDIRRGTPRALFP